MAAIDNLISVTSFTTEQTIFPAQAVKANNDGEDLSAYDRIGYQIHNTGNNFLIWTVQSSATNQQGNDSSKQGEWQDEYQMRVMQKDSDSFKIHDNMKKYWRVIAYSPDGTTAEIRRIAKDFSFVGTAGEGERT